VTSYNTLLVEKSGPAYVVTLNRPKVRNAISTVMMDELIDLVTRLDGDDSVRTIIITGGTEYFAAGADLNEALQVKSATQGMDYFGRWHRVCAALESSNSRWPATSGSALKARPTPLPARESARSPVPAPPNACRASSEHLTHCKSCSLPILSRRRMPTAWG